MALAFSVATANSCAFAETLVIINTASHDVVIGIYEPTNDGVSERLVSVKSMTEIRNVPIAVEDNDCFAIAYKASGEGDIKRAAPAVIQGMAKIVSAGHRDRKVSKAEIVLQYRASGLNPESDSQKSNLYTPYVSNFRESIERELGDRLVKIDYMQIERSGRTKP